MVKTLEEIRSKIEDGLSKLHNRCDKVKKNSKIKRKKRSDYLESALIKEGQKITGVQGVFIMADLLTARIAKICINGMVSAGHDIEDVYKKQVDKYKLNLREQAQVMELLDNMGYALRQDRGYSSDEDVDVSSSNNIDWAANYRG